MRIKAIIKYTLFSAYGIGIMSLAACGGGGGDNASSNAVISVGQLAPQNNAVQVSTLPEISAIFDQEMIASSINDASFLLQKINPNGADITITSSISYDVGSQKVNLNASEHLDFLSDYKAILTASNSSLNGDPLPLTEWLFKTRDGHFTDVQLVNPQGSSTFVEQSSIDMNENGQAMLVWTQGSGRGSSSIMASYFTQGQWQAEEVISIYGRADQPQVSINADGIVTAIWRQYDVLLREDKIMVRRFENGAWQTAEIISSGSYHSKQPQINMFDDGTSLAIWLQFDGAADSVMSSQQQTTWQTPVKLETIDFRAYSPQLSVNSNGDAMAVWSQYDGVSDNNVFVNHFSNNQWQASATLIETLSGDAYSAEIILGEDGFAVATWVLGETSNFTIYANQFKNGQWQTEAAVENDAGYAERPKVGLDQQGVPHIVWRHNATPSEFNIMASQFTQDQWQAAVAIDQSNDRAFTHSLKSNKNGSLIAIWRQSENIMISRYNQQWGAPEALDAAPVDVKNPKLSIADNGEIIAVWEKTENALNYNASRYFTGIDP